MKSYKISTKKDKKDNSVQLILEGLLNVSNIGKIKAEFDLALKNQRKINILLENVDDADVAIVQLLKSFQQQCNKDQIEFSVSLNLNSDIQKLFLRADFMNLFEKN